MLSLNTPLSEVIHYGETVDPDTLEDALIDLEAYRAIADTPAEMREMLTSAEEWQDVRINGMRHNCSTPEQLQDTIDEYTTFYSDCVQTVEEYYGSFMGTDAPYSFHEHIAEEFAKHDDLKTVLANVRQAIIDGESLDYIASLLPQE